jgi:hypothetical protein
VLCTVEKVECCHGNNGRDEGGIFTLVNRSQGVPATPLFGISPSGGESLLNLGAGAGAGTGARSKDFRSKDVVLAFFMRRQVGSHFVTPALK